MFILNVNVSGEPRPKISWMLNGKPLSATGNVRIDTGADYSNLQVKGSTAKNGGKYTITAENSVGQATADLVVKVMDRPSAPRSLRVTQISADFASLAWEEPEADGGAPITEYVIEKKDTSKANWINAGMYTREFCIYIIMLLSGSPL